MDARDNGNNNPFENSLCCLEWIASAIDAARRHNEQKASPGQPWNGGDVAAAARDSAE
jgi:hypothetical protein